MNKLSFVLAAATLSAAFAAGAAPSAGMGAVDVRQGIVEQVTDTQIAGPHHAGIGAVVGGLGGFAVGNLMGRGTGRDVARVLGAVGGAVGGSQMQRNYDRPLQGQHIIVRTDSGVLVAVTQPFDSRMRARLSVYVEGNGEAARVVPR